MPRRPSPWRASSGLPRTAEAQCVLRILIFEARRTCFGRTHWTLRPRVPNCWVSSVAIVPVVAFFVPHRHIWSRPPLPRQHAESPPPTYTACSFCSANMEDGGQLEPSRWMGLRDRGGRMGVVANKHVAHLATWLLHGSRPEPPGERRSVESGPGAEAEMGDAATTGHHIRCAVGVLAAINVLSLGFSRRCPLSLRSSFAAGHDRGAGYPLFSFVILVSPLSSGNRGRILAMCPLDFSEPLGVTAAFLRSTDPPSPASSSVTPCDLFTWVI